MAGKTQNSTKGEFFSWLLPWSYKAAEILQIFKYKSNFGRDLWSGKSLVEEEHMKSEKRQKEPYIRTALLEFK